MPARPFIFGLVIAATPLSAPAQQPLSAIDWLSQSVAAAPATAPVLPEEAPVTGNALPPAVTVTPLDGPSRNGLGLLPSATTGLPQSLWSATPEQLLVSKLRGVAPPALPALQEFLKVLALAEADPPAADGGNSAFYLARVDILLDMGALEAAQALLEAAEPDTPEVFRRWFDVALLTGTEDAACRVMQDRPAVAPTYPARIFCLARSGDWNAAALTLNTHRVLGDVTLDEEALLSRFLDPELYEGEPQLPPPPRPSPLQFRMREAIGEGMGTARLPLAFAHADLRDTAGWKAQLDAAERLTRHGALSANVLQALYTSRAPSASGGVWDRVEAFQRFDVALRSRDPGAVSRHLPPAWQAMQAIRAETHFAALYGAALQALPLTGEAARLAFRIGLLSPDYETVAVDTPQGDPYLRALAQGRPDAAGATGAVAQAVQAGFSGQPLRPELADRISEGRLGEVLLEMLDLFAAGGAGDTRAISDGLTLMRSVGLEDLARRTALQLLLLDRTP